MELTLIQQAKPQFLVTCDSKSPHPFAPLGLIPDAKKGPPQPLDDPVAYGRAIYGALFPPGTLARRALDKKPERILLVTTDSELDAFPWEYAYGSYGIADPQEPGGSESFLVVECPFVRGLPADQRIDPPVLESGLHMIAVPSHPLSTQLEPLNIDGEWTRLKEIIQEVPYSFTLERTRPPTIEQVRRLVANQRQRVVHFMGHGGQHETGAVLCFEKENGDLNPVTAKQFIQRVRGTVFLVTLNACVSATPGLTLFSNLAAALVQQKTPYALGMRMSIHDDDARAFSRSLYSDLASGTSVEEALFQARLTLGNGPRPWVIGVPVLYTSLTTPPAGFPSIEGSPWVKETQPHSEVRIIPAPQGEVQRRVVKLKQLGV